MVPSIGATSVHIQDLSPTNPNSRPRRFVTDTLELVKNWGDTVKD